MRNRNLNIIEYAIIFIMVIMFAIGVLSSKIEERKNKTYGNICK